MQKTFFEIKVKCWESSSCLHFSYPKEMTGHEILDFFLIKSPPFFGNQSKVNKDKVAFQRGNILAGSVPFCVWLGPSIFFPYTCSSSLWITEGKTWFLWKHSGEAGGLAGAGRRVSLMYISGPNHLPHLQEGELKRSFLCELGGTLYWWRCPG